MTNIENKLWVEKYRPKILSEYVGNEDLKSKIQIWLDEGEIQHLLLYGNKPGTGKTSLALLLAKTLDCDFLYINASEENSVDVVREKITKFVSTIGFKKWKIVILDESDFTTPSFQAALRNTLETFSKSSRFILTCNYLERIIEPIQSRCVSYHILPPSKLDVAKRCVEILNNEGVKFSKEDLAGIIKKFYPDMRRVINALQSSSKSGELKIDKQTTAEIGYMDLILEELIKTKSAKDCFTNIRQIIANSRVKLFDDLYRFLFDHVEEISPTNQGSIILTIAESMNNDITSIDKEINIMAMFVKIINEIK